MIPPRKIPQLAQQDQHEGNGVLRQTTGDDEERKKRKRKQRKQGKICCDKVHVKK